MLVDVTFDGVPLARGANARPDGNGWFVELEQPMPVGTLLQISGEAQASVRVERVVEGAGAGMLLQPTAAEKAAPEKPAEKAPEPKKADAKSEAKADAKSETKADDGDDEAEGAAPVEKEKGGSNGAGKERRRKNRKN